MTRAKRHLVSPANYLLAGQNLADMGISALLETPPPFSTAGIF